MQDPYPVFHHACCVQATVASVNGWARSMSYDRSKEVGDVGTYFVSDEVGTITRIIPSTATATAADSDAR